MRKDGRTSNYCGSIWGGGLPYGILVRCERLFKHQGDHRSYNDTTGEPQLEWRGKPIAEEMKHLPALLEAEGKAEALPIEG